MEDREWTKVKNHKKELKKQWLDDREKPKDHRTGERNEKKTTKKSKAKDKWQKDRDKEKEDTKKYNVSDKNVVEEQNEIECWQMSKVGLQERNKLRKRKRVRKRSKLSEKEHCKKCERKEIQEPLNAEFEKSYRYQEIQSLKDAKK